MGMRQEMTFSLSVMAEEEEVHASGLSSNQSWMRHYAAGDAVPESWTGRLEDGGNAVAGKATRKSSMIWVLQEVGQKI